MDQIKEKQMQIQVNQTLKNITWRDSGIPTLTQQASTSKPKKVIVTEDYPQDFILDFDDVVTKENGHKLNCTCKKCLKIPRSDEVKVISSIETEPYIQPLSKKRY